MSGIPAAGSCRCRRCDRSSQTPCAASLAAWLSACAPRWLPAPCSVMQLCQRPKPGQRQPSAPTHPSNDLLDPFLVTLHLQEGLDLADGEVLPVSERHELVKGADKLKGISEDLAFVEALAGAGDDLGKQVQRVDVLKDVGLLVGNKHHVQLVQRLVDKADVVLLDRRMLRARVCRLREGCQEGFETRPLDVVEGPREDGLAPASADGRSENNLFTDGFLVSISTSAVDEYAWEPRKSTIFVTAAEKVVVLSGLVCSALSGGASTLELAAAAGWNSMAHPRSEVWSIWPNVVEGLTAASLLGSAARPVHLRLL